MIWVIRILEAEATLEIIEIEGEEKKLGKERGHTREKEAEIKIIEEELIEIGKIQDPEVEKYQPLET